MVEGLLATQEDDGYLGTYAPAQRWTEWDVWVHKYALLGLTAQARSRGCAASLAGAGRIVVPGDARTCRVGGQDRVEQGVGQGGHGNLFRRVVS